VLYLIEDTVENRALRRKKIMLHEYPDGSISLYNGATNLKFSKLYDRVAPVVQGAVVTNERIASLMNVIKTQQVDRKYKRSTRCPRRNHVKFMEESEADA
jgi:hypothetical protein